MLEGPDGFGIKYRHGSTLLYERELRALSDHYKRVAGYSIDQLGARTAGF